MLTRAADAPPGASRDFRDRASTPGPFAFSTPECDDSDMSFAIVSDP